MVTDCVGVVDECTYAGSADVDGVDEADAADGDWFHHLARSADGCAVTINPTESKSRAGRGERGEPEGDDYDDVH